MLYDKDKEMVEEYAPQQVGLIDKFLGVSGHKQRTLSKEFPGYKIALFCKAMTEVSKGYNVRAIFGLRYGRLDSPIYSYLTVGRGNREELLVAGFQLLRTDKGEKLVTQTYPTFRGIGLDFRYRKEDNELALTFLAKIEKYMIEHNFYKGEKITPAGEFLPIPKLTFEDIKLDEDKKTAIKVGALEFFSKREIYEKNDIPYKRGLIFTGLPGTGKTYTGKILLSQSESTFIWVTSDMVRYAEDVKYLYNMARDLAPCILFMEDLDDFLESSRAVDSIKTQMDGLQSVDGICTILCTNYPERLPQALIDRPSRFDDIIVFNLPDENLRYEILLQLSKNMNIKDKERSLKHIASKSEELTGAHLKEILVFSILLAANDNNREEIRLEDLQKALKKVLRTRDIVNNEIKSKSVEDILDIIKTEKEKDKTKKKEVRAIIIEERRIIKEILICPYCRDIMDGSSIEYSTKYSALYHVPCGEDKLMCWPSELGQSDKTIKFMKKVREEENRGV